jgi:hypothetical protein
MTTAWPYAPHRPFDHRYELALRDCGCEFDPWVFGHDYAFCRVMQLVRAAESSHDLG